MRIATMSGVEVSVGWLLWMSGFCVEYYPALFLFFHGHLTMKGN